MFTEPCSRLLPPCLKKCLPQNFKKKTSEIPLPGKSSTEVKEFLVMIYSFASEKQITKGNCYFLLKLAHEYQMDAIVQKCEDFLLENLKTKPKNGVLADLIFAQTYKLEKLRRASVCQAHNLSLKELKKDKMYGQIQSENLKEIMEGIIQRLQCQLDARRGKIR